MKVFIKIRRKGEKPVSEVISSIIDKSIIGVVFGFVFAAMKSALGYYKNGGESISVQQNFGRCAAGFGLAGMLCGLLFEAMQNALLSGGRPKCAQLFSKPNECPFNIKFVR